MIAAIVVPLGSCNILSTTDCLEVEDVDLAVVTFTALVLAELVDFGTGVGLRLRAVGGFEFVRRTVLAVFDFDLAVI
jgi:hypothetical protein